jgi:hypothetical protein
MKIKNRVLDWFMWFVTVISCQKYKVTSINVCIIAIIFNYRRFYCSLGDRVDDIPKPIRLPYLRKDDNFKSHVCKKEHKRNRVHIG